MIIDTLEQGFVFALVAIGVSITYRILDFPDLSVDGTFPLGASVVALCLSVGMNPFLALICSFLFGLLAGGVTALLHVKFKISKLLSGILVMIGLYSINLRIMGSSNVQFFNFDKIFDHGAILNNIFQGVVLNKIIIAISMVLIIKILMDKFLDTRIGYLLKFAGDNETVVTSLGVSKDKIKIMGLMLSNGIVAFAGGVQAQYIGFSEVNMGTGMVVAALAAIIIGEAICKLFKNVKVTTIAILGGILYKVVEVFAINIRILEASDFKLITALIVIIVLGINNTGFSLSKLKSKLKKEKYLVVNDSSIPKSGEVL